MAYVDYSKPTYRTGAAMSYPIVMKAPYRDWHDLIIRVKNDAGSTVFIGALVKLKAAVSSLETSEEVNVTGDKALNVAGIVLDTVANKKQLSIDNAGAAPTKALFFAADSYIDILPLVPGFILSMRIVASQAVALGTYICSDATGAGRLLAGIATDVDQQAKIGRVIGAIQSGTGVSYVAMAVV